MKHILEGLSKEERIKVKELSIVQQYEKEEIIFEVGEEPEFLYVLLEGLVYVCDISMEGNRNILTMISEENDCFGEVYLFTDIDYPYEAVAMRKAIIMKIPRTVVQDVVGLSRNMNVILAHKAYTLSRKLQLMMKDSLKEKIIEYLARHQNVTLKRYELADYLGVTRPALSKELYRMIDEGVIVINEKGMLTLTSTKEEKR